jgi:hypothetical protein
VAEAVARLFLEFVILCVATPIYCLLVTPYVLLRPVFLKENRSYWREVRNEYGRQIEMCLKWGDIGL